MKKRNFLYLLLLLNQLADGRQFQKASAVKKAIESAGGNEKVIKRTLSELPTFNFPVECSIYNAYKQTTWLGAAENIEGDEAEYSISCARHQTIEGGSGQFEATLVINSRAPEKAHLFMNKGEPSYSLHAENPLRGKACKIMEEHNSNPLIVLKASPNDLYYFSEILLDDKGRVSDVVSLSRYSFDSDEIIHHVVSYRGKLYVFHSKNKFGQDSSSKITVLSITLDHVEIADGKKEKIVDGKKVIGADGRPEMVEDKKRFSSHKISVVAEKEVNKLDAVFTRDGQSEISQLGPEIKTIEYDNKLIAAFSVQSKQGSAACGLVRLEVQEKPKEESEDVNESEKEELVAESDPEGTRAPEEDPEDSKENKVDLKHDLVLLSVVPEDLDLARLPFCTVNGAVALPKELAVMSTSTAADYLMYAVGDQVTAVPVDKDGVVVTKGLMENNYSSQRFLNRSYKKGEGSNLVSTLKFPYEIETLQVVGDSVYVQDKVRAGIYSYRALFNEDGSIGGWCEGEKISSAEGENVRFISGMKAYSWYGVRGDSSYSYNQTVWESSTDSIAEFVDAVNQSLPQDISGVQGLSSLVCNKLYQPRDLLVATGYEHAVYGHIAGEASKVMSAQVVALPDAGALVTAEVAGVLGGGQEWLLLGGVGGLYGYASSDGSGFGVIDGIDDLFTSERSWRKIGDFSFVRKVVKDKTEEDLVYVVTSQGVYKTRINQSSFTSPQVEKVFDSSIIGGRFDYVSDLIVDREFAIVGTSKGLYVIEDMNDPSKTYKLHLDGTVGSVAQITALKGSKDFDNVYILSNNQQRQMSSVHRIVVRNKECKLFADCTHQHGNSEFGIRGAFLSMESTCSSFFSNGSWNVKMNYPYKDERRSIMCYSSGIRSGVDTIRTANRNNLQSMYLSCVEGSQNIGGMVHNSALGCWIIFGDFGLRILS